jgi:subtilisin-like proprotein convertase family protein
LKPSCRLFVSGLLFHLAALAVASAQVIHLNAGDIRPGRVEKASPALAATEDFPGGRLHLVQFAGPIQPEWVEQLKGRGFRIVDYIPENAYLVYGDASAVKSLQARAKHVKWQGAYLAGDKIHPRAKPEAAKARRALTGEDDLFAVQLVLDEAANAETVALLQGVAKEPLKRNKAFRHYRNIVVRMAPAEVEAVAARPDVISIAPYVMPRKFDERQGMIVAGQLAGNGPSGPGYLAWLTSKGFTQQQFIDSGIVVDVCDSGIDNGSTNANHFGLYTAGNTALASRVVYARLEGTPNSPSTIQGCDGHGTLNAHIIGGYNNSSSGFPHQDSAGYRYGLGIAPYVKLGSSTIFDSDNFTSPDYSDMISRAYRDGAKISSDSWGADTYGGYDIDAQEYDALVRDAQPAGAAVSTAGNQEMTIVFAAGNAGGAGAGSVGSPGTAKNVITVGAAENVHSHATTNGGNNASGNDGCDTPDSEANSANDVASFSSRGPCSDGRRKPEIMAPGTHVTGGVAQEVKAMAGNGNDIACFDGTGVCALPGGGTAGSTNNFFPLGQQWYSTSSGTSHSTPAVAGGAALVYQYFLNQGWGAPSPAMVKAYLMNSSRYMTGVDAGDNLWSNNQGMGMMNLGFAFDGADRILRDQVPADTFTASGQSRAISGLVVDAGQPVRVTLTWTDAPGSTSGNAYNNNLNLSVVAAGKTYLGNVFNGAVSTNGGTADAKNNTESVFLPAGTTGAVTVVVTAANITSDGVPNVEPALDQDYALVIYNLEEVEMAVVMGESAELVAESCGVVGNDAIDPDETVTVDFVLRNVGSANTTNVVATLLATGGVTSPDGPHGYGALLAGGAAVTQSFTFAATGECGGMLTATLALEDNGMDLGVATFDFRLGGTTETSQSKTNTTAITIVDNASASPYPGTIAISNLPGTVSKVTATLRGFTHTYPADVDILLVSPDGAAVSLMSELGGGTGVSGATLTFDDAAASIVGTPVVSGTYLPSGSAYEMNAPAPAPPYGSAMADFNGGNPNGVWKLYVLDAGEGDTGSIAQGWSITVTVAEPLCCGSNKPPVFGYLPNQSIVESNLLSFAVVATDPYDGDPITLTASNLPAGSTFGATNGNGSFTWESPEPTGAYSVSFYAEDKDGTTEKTISIEVFPTPFVDTNCWVLISEYVEGSSNNKAIEIYNPTAEPIDLAAGQYVVQIYFNGNTTATAIPLTGTVLSQDVFVLANSSAGAGILGAADMVSASVTFNGDDAVVLRVGGTNGAVLDCIGQVGFRPATEWGSGVTSTADNTIRRKPTVKQGNTNTTAAFDPATEWDGFSVDTFNGLGTHTSDCSGPPVPTPPILNSIGSQSVAENGTLQFQVVATPTDSDAVTLTASNLPAGATFNATNETGTFQWMTASPTGVYSVTFTATDKDGADEETIAITVGAAGPSGDTYAETFDNTAFWGGGAFGSYTAKSFTNNTVGPVGDFFMTTSAVRETVYSVSSNSWRLGSDSVQNVYLRYVAPTNITRVAVQLARWDNSPTPNFEIRYSTNEGVSYTTLLATNGNWFTVADKAFQAYDSGAVDIQPAGGLPVWIEVFRSSGERLLVDSFEVDYGGGGEPPAGTPPVLNPIGGREAFLGQTLQFQVSATPTESDPVTLSVSNLPAGAAFYPTNELGTFLWANASPTGEYSVVFYATDKDGSNGEAVGVYVYPLPQVGVFTMSNGTPASASIQSVDGQEYWLEYSLDLVADPVVWTPVESQMGTGGLIILSDTNTLIDLKRYYRIVVP